MVNVIRKGVEPAPVIQARNTTINSIKDTNKAIVVSAFANLGMTHVVPTCSGRIESQETGVLGSRISYATMSMKNEDADKNLMPVETRQFSGEVDFSNIPAGNYIVTTTLSYGLGQSNYKQSSRTFEVFDSNGEKLIYLTGENTRPVASSGG